MRGEEQLAYQVIGTDGGLLDRPYPAKEALLAPGEQRFVFHCHNLEHENADMMVNYRIPA